jgi:hypothetical protein
MDDLSLDEVRALLAGYRRDLASARAAEARGVTTWAAFDMDIEKAIGWYEATIAMCEEALRAGR